MDDRKKEGYSEAPPPSAGFTVAPPAGSIGFSPEVMAQAPPPQATAPQSPPPAYGQVAQSSWKLSYVDFTPQCTSPGGILSSPVFERFDVLIKRANQWLASHPDVKVKTCESIENKCKMGSYVDTEKVTFKEYGEHRNCFVRSLRMFLVPRDLGDPSEPQQLGYLNIVPACTDPGGVFSAPKFESFGETVTKFNQMMRERPLPGFITNIETQEMKFKSWGNEVDPDKCYWTEHGDHNTYYLYVIRLFYVAGPPAYQDIGAADFLPDQLREGGILSHPEFAPFHTLVDKARQWIQQNPSINVTNIQSIDYKLKGTWSGGCLDSQRSLFREHGEMRTYFVRILRVCFTTSPGGAPAAPAPILTYKTFCPVQLTQGGMFTVPEFETMSQTMQRAMSWLQYNTNIRVLSAETVAIRMYSGHQWGNTEQTYTYNPGDRNEQWLFVLRVYMNGYCQEPPPQALPPMPQVQQGDTDCCRIL